jgi:replicative DNA helicase
MSAEAPEKRKSGTPKQAAEPNLRDEQAEAALLSAVFETPGLAEDGSFTTALFLSASNRLLAEALIELRSKGTEPTPANILLHTKNEELAKLAEKLCIRKLGGSPPLLMARLEEVRQRSQMARIAREMHDCAFDEAVVPDGALDGFEQQIMGVRRRAKTGLHRGGDMKGVLEEIRWRAANPTAIRGRSTGIPMLDELMDGLIGGEEVIIAGRPSVGKTAIMANMIEEEISQDGIPLVFSLEMSATSLKKRILASVARVPTSRTGRPWTPAEAAAIAMGIKKMSSWNWFLDETPRADIAYIRRTARQLKREHNITSVWIDYLQLVSVASHRKGKQLDRRLEIAEVTGEGKAMAKELDVPVVFGCQIRRPQDIYDKTESRTRHQRPELHHLKESGDIEQDADQVILIDRDQRENATKATLILAKNRNGGTGEVAVEYMPHLCRFRQAIS